MAGKMSNKMKRNATPRKNKEGINIVKDVIEIIGIDPKI